MFNNTVAILKDSIRGILTGVNITDEVTSLNQAIERGLRVMATKIAIPEASVIQSIIIYGRVKWYRAPDSIFGGALTDFRKQGNNTWGRNEVFKLPISPFARTEGITPGGTALTFEYNNGTALMGVKTSDTLPSVLLDPMSSLTGWSAEGDATGLVLDTVTYYDSPAALRFSLPAAGSSGGVVKTLSSSIDLTEYNGVGVVFLAVYVPDATPITSISCRIGSSPTNYFENTAIAPFIGDSFVSGEWQLVPFNLATATQTGTVDITKINFLQPYVNYNGAACPNVRFGNLFVSIPSAHNVYFQTVAIFKAVAATSPSSVITSNSDQILLNDAAYTIFEFEAANAVLLNSSGSISGQMAATINQILHGVRARNGAVITLGLYDHYSANNPSQELRSYNNYYLD